MRSLGRLNGNGWIIATILGVLLDDMLVYVDTLDGARGNLVIMHSLTP
jgi:hypothetical protein